jgi:hypothetical protein
MRQVVTERGAARHLLHECRELSLRVELLVQSPRVEQAVVPVVAANERIDSERVTGVRGVDGADALRLVDPERFPIAAPADLHVPPAPNVVVLKWIERNQHADPAIRLGVKHQEISIPLCACVHAHAVAPPHVAALVQPDLDWCLGLSEDRGVSRRYRER